MLMPLLGLTLSPGRSDAVPIMSESGLAAPAATITFSESVVSPGTTITNQFSSLGVTFSPYLIYQSPQGSPSCCDGIESHHLGNSGSTTLADTNPFSIKFTIPQTEAAFGLATVTTTTRFEALLAGVPVESFFSGTADEYNGAGQPIGPFFGFSGGPFDELRVTVGVSSPDDTVGSLRALLDNVQLGQSPPADVSATLAPTPEPTTLLLFGTTAGGLGLVRWHRRRRR